MASNRRVVNSPSSPALKKGERIRRFFELEAKSISSKHQVIETLLPSHKTKGSAHVGEEGRYIESLLRDFLNRHLPGDIRAVSGFILCPATKIGAYDLSRVHQFDDRHSRQMDIIVYDFSSFPVYEKFEEFCVVPPEGVIGIVSVKKRLYSSQIHDELISLHEAAMLCMQDGRRGPYTGVFCFDIEDRLSESGPESCFSAIVKVHDGHDFALMINEISVLGNFVVFKFNSEDSDKDGFAKYVNVLCKGQGDVALQRLINSILSVYFDKSRGSPHVRPGFVSFEQGIFRKAPTLGYVKRK